MAMKIMKRRCFEQRNTSSTESGAGGKGSSSVNQINSCDSGSSQYNQKGKYNLRPPKTPLKCFNLPIEYRQLYCQCSQCIFDRSLQPRPRKRQKKEGNSQPLKGKRGNKTTATKLGSQNVQRVVRLSKPFKCSECNSTMAFKYELTKHLVAVHPGIKPFSCSHSSGFVTAYKYSIKKHELKMHQQKKSFNGEICHDGTSYKVEQKRHLLVHSTTNSFYLNVLDVCEQNQTIDGVRFSTPGFDDKLYQRCFVKLRRIKLPSNDFLLRDDPKSGFDTINEETISRTKAVLGFDLKFNYENIKPPLGDFGFTTNEGDKDITSAKDNHIEEYSKIIEVKPVNNELAHSKSIKKEVQANEPSQSNDIELEDYCPNFQLPECIDTDNRANPVKDIKFEIVDFTTTAYTKSENTSSNNDELIPVESIKREYPDFYGVEHSWITENLQFHRNSTDVDLIPIVSIKQERDV